MLFGKKLVRFSFELLSDVGGYLNDTELFAAASESGCDQDDQVAFAEAARILKEHFLINVDQQADMAIISAGGYPKDINLYQGIKGLTHSIEAVKQGGSVVYLAEASDGIGNPNFEQWVDDASAEIGSIDDPLERAAKAFDFLKNANYNGFILSFQISQNFIHVGFYFDI